ncbi:MAG: dTMP kinase [Chloroflexi bacterium]|nr:dTMP kinase [Chloroflexota bacterium]
MSVLSLLVTFEGPEGSGKTTQIPLLADYLRERGYDVLCTREPGGTAIGEQIREVILSSKNDSIGHETEALLFSAARAQIVAQVIRPALAAGRIVLCDRYADSTIAYQGYGLGLDLEALRAITTFATGGLIPDLTFYIDVPADIGLARKKGQAGSGAGEMNRLDQKEMAYHTRVRKGYIEMARQAPERWVVIDGTHSAAIVQKTLRERLDEELKKRGI